MTYGFQTNHKALQVQLYLCFVVITDMITDTVLYLLVGGQMTHHKTQIPVVAAAGAIEIP